MSVKRIGLFALTAALTLSAAPTMAKTLVASLSDGRALTLAVPEDWQSSQEAAGPALTIRLSSGDSASFVVLLTVLPITPGSPASTPDGLKVLAIEQGNQALKTALQERLELTEIKGQQAIGYVYHVTDRKPEKGPRDYREADQGIVLLGRHVVAVTILTHPNDSATVELAKQMIAGAQISSDH